jgi:hypothetical protein
MNDEGQSPKSTIPDWLRDALVALAIAMVGSVTLQFIDEAYGPKLAGMRTASFVATCGPLVWFVGRRSGRSGKDLLFCLFLVAVLFGSDEFCERMQLSEWWSFGLQMTWILGWSMCEAVIGKFHKKPATL